MIKTKSNRIPKSKLAAGAFPAIENIPFEAPQSTNPHADSMQDGHQAPYPGSTAI